jgi:hypothetical protein
MTGKQAAVLAITGAAGMAGTGALVGGLVAGGGSKIKVKAALTGAGIGAIVGAIFTPLAGWVSEYATNAIGTSGTYPNQRVLVHSRLAPMQGAAGALPNFVAPAQAAAMQAARAA